MRDERGFSLIEVLAAALLLAIGLAFTLVSFAAPQKQTLTAQRQSQMAAIAEREVERLAQRPWDKLGLASNPVPVATQFDPRSHLVANTNCGNPSPGGLETCLRVRQNFNAETPGPLTGTAATGEPIVSVAGGATPTGTVDGATVHRFVTWKDREVCLPQIAGGGFLDTLLASLLGPLLSGLSDALRNSLLGTRLNIFCSSAQTTKRVTVAVTLPAAGNQAGPHRPVWISTLVPNPSSGVFNSGGNIGANCLVVLFLPVCNPAP